MKAIFITLLLALSVPFSLIAAEDAHAGAHDAISDVASHGEAATPAEVDKLTMITDKFGVKLPTLIAQMINFCLVALVLYKFAVKPIVATLDERQQKIADGLQYAEEMKAQLAAAERERAEKIKTAAVDAQKILTESREQSKEMIEQKTQEAAAQAEAIIRKASEATELERQKMLLMCVKKSPAWLWRRPQRCFLVTFQMLRNKPFPILRPRNWLAQAAKP